MIKYLHWKWYDWFLTLPVSLWVILTTMMMSPAIVVEYMIMMVPRTIRENRFYDRHDFGEFEDESELDDIDRKALKEMQEEHVIGNFMYRSKMVKVWLMLMTFHKAGALR